MNELTHICKECNMLMSKREAKEHKHITGHKVELDKPDKNDRELSRWAKIILK